MQLVDFQSCDDQTTLFLIVHIEQQQQRVQEGCCGVRKEFAKMGREVVTCLK